MIASNSVHDFADVDAAYAYAAHNIAAILSSGRRERITLAISGGRSPVKLFEMLAEEAPGRDIPWEKVIVCWVDERFVPADHPESNYGLARKWLLSRLPIRADQVFPMCQGQPSATRAAMDYEQTLRRIFLPETGTDKAPAGVFPRFDLVLLGMGPDGHIASLFPGKPALQEQTRWVTDVPEPGMPPDIPRVTLTLPLLNNARNTLALVTGSKKQPAFREATTDPRSTLPAALLAPKGEMAWVTCFRD